MTPEARLQLWLDTHPLPTTHTRPQTDEQLRAQDAAETRAEQAREDAAWTTGDECDRQAGLAENRVNAQAEGWLR